MPPSRDSRFVRITLIILFILLIGYAFYEAQGALCGPTISVPETAVTVHERSTLITGKALRITKLSLNGAPIAVTEDGHFEVPVILAEGSNHLILEAEDARGRTARKMLNIVYEPGT